MLVVVVLGAVQMFVLALMGEYIGRLYNEVKHRPLYIVQEVAGEAAPHARLGISPSAINRLQPPNRNRRISPATDERALAERSAGWPQALT